MSAATCAQNVTVFDSTDTLIHSLSCESNGFDLTVNDTYVQLKFTTMKNSSDITLWLHVKVTGENNMTIRCSPSEKLFCTAKDSSHSTIRDNKGETIGTVLLGSLIGSSICFVISLGCTVICLMRKKSNPRSRILVLEGIPGRFCRPWYQEAAWKNEETEHDIKDIQTTLTSRAVSLAAQLPDLSVRDDEATRISLADDFMKLRKNDSEDEILACKERPLLKLPDTKIQIVQPLKTFEGETSDDKSNEKRPDNRNNTGKLIPSSQNIDWHSVFISLIQMLPANKWKLFFTSLYGYGESLNVFPVGMTVEGKISQIEVNFDIKSHGVETLFYQLFQEWRELFGLYADAYYIEEALREMGYNYVLSRFQSMMRNPPMRNTESQRALIPPDRSSKQVDVLSLFNQVQGPPTPYLCYTLHEEETSKKNNRFGNSFHMQLNESKYAVGIVSTTDHRQNIIPGTTQEISSKLLNHVAVTPKTAVTTGYKRKRISVTSDSDTEDDRPCKHRKFKDKYTLVKRKSSRRKRHRVKYSRQSKTLVSLKDFDKNSCLDLIMRFLPFGGQLLNEKEYHLFLDHTVSLIMKKTHKSEKDVLSMLCSDYDQNQKYTSKRHGYIHYVIETDSTCFTIEKEEWNCLKLFTEHARKGVINRLNSNDTFVDSDYLFIRFDGTPLIQQLLQQSESDSDDLPSSSNTDNNDQDDLTIPKMAMNSDMFHGRASTVHEENSDKSIHANTDINSHDELNVSVGGEQGKPLSLEGNAISEIKTKTRELIYDQNSGDRANQSSAANDSPEVLNCTLADKLASYLLYDRTGSL